MNIGIIILAMTLISILLVGIACRISKTNQLLLTLINAMDINHLLLRQVQLKKPTPKKNTR
jgi:hypothetical protein